MSDAISTLSAADGALRGWGAADQYFRAEHQERRQNEADKLNAERVAEGDRRYQESVEFRNKSHNERMALQKANAESIQAARAEQTENNRWMRSNQERMAKMQELTNRANIEFQKAMQGLPVDPEYLQQIETMGMNYLNPYELINPDIQQKAAGSQKLFSQLQSGNTAFANSPEGIAIANEVLGAQIKQGASGFDGPMGIGKQIADKELSRWIPAPGGKGVVPMLKITYSDGASAEKPWTAARTSDEGDPVMPIPVEKLVDRLQGQIILANSAKDPQVINMIQKSYAAFNQGNGSTAAGTQSATGKTISDLVHWGVPQQEAIQLATLAKTDPTSAIASLTNTILKNQDPYAENRLSTDQAAMQAKEIIMSIKQESIQSANEQSGAQGLPDPAQHNGRTIRDTQTNKRYQSNGNTWVEIQ